MWYSVQILADRSIHIEPSNFTKKHGPIGKVLINYCLYPVALRLQEENSKRSKGD